MKQKLTIALAGNPNSGKTTIFNYLTGAQQKVANYPGVTVEKKVGFCSCRETEIEIIDLPGIYSLSVHSEEEVIARNYLLEESPDAVVQIIDAANIHRSLFLTLQLMELGLPLLLVFNMMDMVQKEQMVIDVPYFSAVLELPIVTTVGRSKKGLSKILEEAVKIAKEKRDRAGVNMNFSLSIEEAIHALTSMMHEQSTERSQRWHAIKLLEADETDHFISDIEKKAQSLRFQIIEKMNLTPEEIIAQERYAFIDSLCEKGLSFTEKRQKSFSDRLDGVLLHKHWGLPLFFIVLFLLFQFTFRLGEYPTNGLKDFLHWTETIIVNHWPDEQYPFLLSLIINGLLEGVGSVLVFLPNIVLLFFSLGFLESSGYMARAAFLMDRFMHKIGLHGRSFVPMLLGFGCSVPAIMATRTLETKRDRIVSIMVIPLFACSAKLVVFTLFIPSFFSSFWSPIILFLFYFIGVVLATTYAWFLRKTLFKGENLGFVMELPPYHRPSLKIMIIHTWFQAYSYLKKAGTLILGFSCFLWVLSVFPVKRELSRDYSLTFRSLTKKYENVLAQIDSSDIQEYAAKVKNGSLENPFLEKPTNITSKNFVMQYKEYARSVSQLQLEKQKEMLSYTLIGRIGHFIEPFFRPLGFDWRIDTALMGAFAAKEVFVAQMGVVYSAGEKHPQTLQNKLQEHYSPLQGFCVLLFILISIPCMGTFVVTRNEMGSWKWAWMQFAVLTGVAYVITLVVYQIGLLWI
ncbi:MAG: ferrous iron transport protein B [Parachlamydiales bacterium]|nr:ferrous iron transport protein B [Parachlamydiales bacterium]